LHFAGAGKVAKRVGQRVGRERNPLAHRQRCGGVIQAERMERHGIGKAPLWGKFYPIAPPRNGAPTPLREAGLMSVKFGGGIGGLKDRSATPPGRRLRLTWTNWFGCCARSWSRL